VGGVARDPQQSARSWFRDRADRFRPVRLLIQPVANEDVGRSPECDVHPGTIARIKAAYDDLARHYAGPDGRLTLRYHALLASGRA